jgi:acyl-CoA thioesterase
MKTPNEIVAIMLEKDEFSKWMNLSIASVELGYCKLSATVHSEMLNGFEILHGGISYSLSDSALAFASNSYGQKCVSIETSISHIRPAKMGDQLIVSAEEIHRGRTIGIYEVKIKNQENQLISLFKGTVHISENVW